MPTDDISELIGRIPELDDGVRFPAVDTAVTRELCQLLIDGAPGSVSAAADSIVEIDDGTDWKVRFLLHQLATFVSAPGKGAERGKIQDAVTALLAEERPVYQKTFLVSQLQFIADSKALPALTDLLRGQGDARLVDAIVAAMVAVGPEARPFLRSAAKEARGEVKAAIENAVLQVG